MMKGWNACLRRTLSFALAVCMVLSMTTPVIAEGEEGGEPCTHPNAYSEPGKAATCTEKGTIDYHCDKCGAEWSLDTELAPHTWALEPVYENEAMASCITKTDGSRDAVIYCNKCGARGTVTPETIPWEHKWDEGTGIPATCTEAGELTYACTADGCTATKTEYPEALDHDFQLTTQGVSTCKDTAMSLYTCTRCPETDEREVPVNPEAHTGPVDEGTVTTKPTCTEDGVRTMVCDGCGESYTVVELATGHTMTPVEGGTAATCTEAGVEKYACSVCGANDVKPISALGHNLSSEVTAGTCTEQGERTFTCSRCSYVHTEPVAPLGHSYNEGTVTPATCTEFGVKTYTCTREGCGQTKTEPVALLAHDWDNGEITPATCSQFGVKTYTCTRERCGQTKTEPIAPLGHSFNDSKVQIKAPTCTEFGVKTYTCTVAGCTATKTEPIALLAHDWDNGEITPATCTEFGVKTYTCTREDCGATKTEPIAPLGHTYNNGEISTQPTCSAFGVKTYTCTREGCGATETEPVAPTGNHTFGGAINVIVASTCAAKGVGTQTCTVKGCDAVKTMELPLAAHNYGGKPACADAYCVVCGAFRQASANHTLEHEHGKYDTVNGNNAAKCSKHSEEHYHDEHIFTCSACQYEVTEVICGSLGNGWGTATINGNNWSIVYSENYKDNGSIGAKPATADNNLVYHTIKQTVPATCCKAGYVEYNCSKSDSCTQNHRVEIPATGAHNMQQTGRTEATCNETGSVIYTCTVCRATETKKIPALGHSFVDTKVQTKAPTCEAAGSMTYTCTHSGCTATETKKIPALGHSFDETKVQTTAPTCTAEGVMTCTCTREGCNATTTEKIPALGHSYNSSKVQTTAPTCTAEGVMISTCTREGCTATTTKEIPALGHSYDNGVVTTPATCAVDGVMTYACTHSGCTEKQTRTITKTLQHTPGTVEYKATKAPTCTETGTQTATLSCTVCPAVINARTLTLAATGHTPAAAVVENRVEAKCTVDGSYDSVIYCSVSGCHAEISRTTMKLVHPGHKPAAAVVENNVDPTCEEDGNYDSVVYCSVCEEELSRKNIVVPAAGHKEAAGVRENNVVPTCTTGGGYDTVVYCSVCNKELKRDHTTLPAAGHGASEMRNTRPASETSEGYTGDMVCSVCGEILTPGTAIPALASGEKVEVDPEVILEVLNEEIKLDTAAVEDLTVLAKENGNNALELMSAVNDTMDALAQELASGAISPAEYARCVEVANVATSVALAVGAKAGSASEEAAKLSESLPAETGLDMGAVVGDFYQRQFDAILGKNQPAVHNTSAFDGDMSGVKLILVADANTTSTGIDLSVDPEVYRSALTFIDDSVDKMSEAAATLRACSGEAMVASVKQYIEKVAVTVFRDFDKEAADEEFLQNAYEAILLNMQQQVSLSLTEAYEEASKSGKFTGTAKTELDNRYAEQMAAVADIETFEIMVLEVMRQKYVSVLNTQLEAGTITRESYDAAWESAYDVDVFEPIYWAIFRAWALNEESEYPMTLQELTDATIADTTYATTHIELRDGLSGQEVAFLTAAAVLTLLLSAAYIVSNSMSKRKVVA